MRQINVAAAKAQLSELLDQVERGEQVTITWHGRPVALVTAVRLPKKPLPLAELTTWRETLPPAKEPSAVLLRRQRSAYARRWHAVRCEEAQAQGQARHSPLDQRPENQL